MIRSSKWSPWGCVGVAVPLRLKVWTPSTTATSTGDGGPISNLTGYQCMAFSSFHRFAHPRHIIISPSTPPRSRCALLHAVIVDIIDDRIGARVGVQWQLAVDPYLKVRVCFVFVFWSRVVGEAHPHIPAAFSLSGNDSQEWPPCSTALPDNRIPISTHIPRLIHKSNPTIRPYIGVVALGFIHQPKLTLPFQGCLPPAQGTNGEYCFQSPRYLHSCARLESLHLIHPYMYVTPPPLCDSRARSCSDLVSYCVSCLVRGQRLCVLLSSRQKVTEMGRER